MPIGDLLAEISGANPSPAAQKASTSSSLKRKAEDDSQNTPSAKLAKSRQQDGPYSASKVIRDVKAEGIDRPKSTPPVSIKPSSLPQRTNSPSTNGRYQPPVPNGQRAVTSTGRPLSGPPSNMSLSKQSSNTAQRPRLNPGSLSAASKAPPARPSPTTPTNSDPSKAPKKGSYQEIMERAKKAQATMGKVGMIQHKAMESSKKERPLKGEQKSSAAKGKDVKSYIGNGRPSATSSREPARLGMVAMVSRGGSRVDAAKDVKPGGKQRPGGEVLEKKVKKSATATTGYTGTARPRPGAAPGKSSSKKESSSFKSRGLLAPPRPSRKDRYEDEYDDDMDDFIDYDDDEDDPRGTGYGYASDASSDMEAGLSDIDVEERRAEMMAREEDKREQALEEKHRREKEERKRRLGR
ncbi:hypothetical protein F4818DRAFT_411728 [Hypoxylon cercidicola]|nr:hypothetical protein F4818DRAFT_411728 [Hypoxylon cercidicola]